MINYKIDEHAVAFPSKLVAQNGGEHIYNIELETDTDNGNLVAKGDFIELDLYKEAAVTSFAGKILDKSVRGHWYVEVVTPGDALLVYSEPLIAEEWTNRFKDEKNFYNAAGETARCYALHAGDVFEVSEIGFTGTPAKGASVSCTNKKLVVATSTQGNGGND